MAQRRTKVNFIMCIRKNSPFLRRGGCYQAIVGGARRPHDEHIMSWYAYKMKTNERVVDCSIGSGNSEPCEGKMAIS